MQKLLSTTIAFAFFTVGSADAADLPAAPLYKAPVVAPPAFSWTGWYVGVNAGWAWNDSTDTITAANAAAQGFVVPPPQIATSLPLSSNGFIGGGQAGYNWQVAPMWVLGFESDIQWADIKKTVSLPGPSAPTRIMTAHEKLDLFGTVRGRVGVAPWDRALFYVTGGLAYGQANLSTALTRPGAPPPVPADGCGGFNNCQAGSTTGTRFGWTVGAGLEWAFVKDWSFKAEYLYYDLGNISHVMTDPFFPATFNASADLKGNIARMGLNYRFGSGGPVVAKY